MLQRQLLPGRARVSADPLRPAVRTFQATDASATADDDTARMPSPCFEKVGATHRACPL